MQPRHDLHESNRVEPVSAAIRCEGAPRDLGFDQGRACRAALAAEFGRGDGWDRLMLRLGRVDPRAARVARDVLRHYPRQAEFLEGIARGAGVPRAWLARALARASASRAWDGAAAVGARAPLTGRGSLLGRRLPGEVVVRRSCPEAGFRSVEVTLPWLTSALAGVNETGLAAAFASPPGAAEAGPCAAPALLLVQDCLERFDSLDAVLDRCLGRPAGGCASVLFADAGGEVAGVEIAGSERRVLRPADDLLVAADPAERGVELAKSLRSAAPIDLPDLGRALPAGGGSGALPSLVGVDPAGRRLGLFDASGVRWFEV